MTDSFAAGIGAAAVLITGYLTNFLAHRYHRFCEGKALASALAGELSAHKNALPKLKELLPLFIEQKRSGQDVTLRDIGAQSSPIFDQGVANLGLLGWSLAGKIAYSYEQIRTFRASLAILVRDHKSMDVDEFAGRASSLIDVIDSHETRRNNLINELKAFADSGFFRQLVWKASGDIADESEIDNQPQASAVVASEKLQTAEANKKGQTSWLAYVSLFISLFAAIVTTAGRAYRGGYVGVYGFDTAPVPWSSADLLYLGVSSQTIFVVEALAVVFVAFLALAALFGGLVALRNISRRKSKRTTNLNGKTGRSAKLHSEVELLLTIAMGTALLLYFAVPIIVFMAHAEREGQDRARREIRAVESRDAVTAKRLGVDYVFIRRVVGGTTIDEQGVQVSCSEKFCDLYDASHTNRQHTVPLDNVVLWEYMPLPVAPRSTTSTPIPTPKEQAQSAS